VFEKRFYDKLHRRRQRGDALGKPLFAFKSCRGKDGKEARIVSMEQFLFH
jgi:hypothetical protein